VLLQLPLHAFSSLHRDMTVGLPDFFKNISFLKEMRWSTFILSWASSAGEAKREIAPPGNCTKKQIFPKNPKSASWFRLNDLILAITFYLLVWHSHCTRVRFTVRVGCSDELAVHSGPLLRLQTQTLRNLRAYCSTVALCWVTITWQRISKVNFKLR